MSSTVTTPTADPTITPPVGPTTIGPDTQDPNKDPNSLEYRSAANVVGRLKDRVWDAIKEGIPAFNSKFEAAAHTDTGTLANGETPKEQLITPEAAMTPKERKAHPIATGIAETAGSFTSPENVAMMAGTGGFGELPGAAGKLIPKLISLGFSATSLKGAYDQLPAFKAAMDRGDESEAERIITHVVLDTAVGAAAGQHATEGVMGEGLAKANTGRTFTKGTDIISPKISPIELSNQVESAAAPALAKPAPVDLSSVGGVPVERRSPDSLGRTPGSVMKKVTDTTYQTMREHGLDTASPEAPAAASGKFAPVDGVELRQPTTFGRTGGSFGRTVDQTYDVLRAQETGVPPVKPGMVRLYRGEGGEGGSMPLGGEGVHAKAGLNFTTDDTKASTYAGKGGTVKYIDVPQSYVNDYRAGTDSPNETTFLLSKEDANKAVEISNQVESNKAEPNITHEAFGIDGQFRRATARDTDGNDVGHLTYHMPVASGRKGDFSATVSMASTDQPGKGLGQSLYLRAAQDAKAQGARYLVSDTITHGTSDSAARVWDKLTERGYPIEKLPNGRYRMDLSKLPDNEISNQVESNVAAPAIHPDLQKLSDKYGVSEDAEKVRNGASFIRPDGRFIHLGNTEHPVAIEKTTGERPTEDLESLGDKIANSSGPEDSRVRFLADTGAIRTRFHYGRNGDETLSVSVPEKGVTEEQVSALKNAFQSSMDGGRGNLVMEVGIPNGKSTQADYVTANEIEPALARIGAMPNQRVNLSDAYGDTGTYIGGHVPLQAGGIGDFPSVQERQQARDIGTTHGPALLDVPASRLDPKQTTLSTIHHEVGHIVAAHQEGIPLDDSYIGSHLSLHSQQTGGAAYTNFNFTKLPGARAVGDNAQFTADGLAKAFPRLLHTLLGGGAVEEILDGIPMKQNEGMGGDLSQIRGIGRALGLTPDETEAQISKGMKDTKARLNKPEILDIIKNASATREEGLSKTLHMSKERVQRDIIQKLNEVTSGKRTENIDTSAGDTAGTVRGADQGTGEAASSREGQVSGGAARGDEPASVQGSLFSKKVKPEEQIHDNGWLDESGKFHPLLAGESHPAGRSRLELGGTNAIRVAAGDDFAIFTPDKNNQEVRDNLTSAIKNHPQFKNVEIDFAGGNNYQNLPAEDAVDWLENGARPGASVKNTVESSKAVASKATRKKALTSKSK